MGKNMLTEKEATLISDLLLYEEQACKKAGLYARIFSDVNLVEELKKIRKEHESRFCGLFELL